LADIRRLIEIHLAAQRREEDRRVGALDGIRQEVMGLTARLAAVEGEIGMAVGMDEAYQEPQPAEHHALRWPEPEPLARVYHRSSRLPPSRPHQSAPLDDAPAASGSTPAVGFPPAGELPHRQSKAGPPREETIGAPRRTNSGAPARSRPAPASPARQAPSGFFSGALLAAIAVLVALGAGLTAYGVLLTGSMNTPAGNGSAPSKGAAVGIGKAAAVGTSADHVMAAELWFPPRASEAPADQAQAPVSLSTAGRPAAKASGLQLASWAPRTASSSASGSDTIAAAPTLPPAAIGPLSLRLAASWGNPSAEFAVARRFAQSGPRRDMAQAVLWYRRSAMHGFAAAQYRLAGLYERGVGVPADLAQSRAWYRSAAEQGNVKAMHNAGVFAARGRGGAIDYAEAARWFREAAEHGVHDSQFNVAIFYESGLGVDQDPVQAFKWFSLAARYDDSEAERRRDRLTILLSPGQLAEGRSLVTAWSRKPAKAAANDARIAAEVWKASRLETG
jgi:localization factor PodJL